MAAPSPTAPFRECNGFALVQQIFSYQIYPFFLLIFRDYANNPKVTSLSGNLPGGPTGSNTTRVGCTEAGSDFIAKMDDGNIQCGSRSADWVQLTTCQSTLVGYELTCCNDVLNKATDATVTCAGANSKVSGCAPGFFKDTSAGNDVCTGNT